MTRKQETPDDRGKRLAEHTEKVLAEQHGEAEAELSAMIKILTILHPLPDDSRKRAMRWVADRLDNFTPPIVSFRDYNDEPPF